MSAYVDFLASKAPIPPSFGVEPSPVASLLYPFQRAVVEWAIRRGRAAVFADCGMGKTLMQLEWARQSGDRVLLVAPIAVGEQTIAEARAKLDLEVRRVSVPSDRSGLQITNYERLSNFIGAPYDAIVLDESSILKSMDGKTRGMLLESFTSIPRRLCCTATPAPNDLAELANHSEFLGVMPRSEMLAAFFVHDSDGDKSAGGWRLKGHAQDQFWRWVAQWGVYLRRPSDLGFEDGAFQLPPLTIRDEVVAAGEVRAPGELFAGSTSKLGGIEQRRAARRGSLDARVERAAAIIGDSRDQWLVWCGLNDEGDSLERAVPGAVQVSGADDEEEKARKAGEWTSGRARVLISKPSIFGWGMNFQQCHRMLFLGLGDSYEAYYQAIRRCWRFGQEHPVEAVIVVSDIERQVAENVRRKEAESERLAAGVVAHAREAMTEAMGGRRDAASADYVTDDATGDGWTMKLGDCVERIKEVPDASAGLMVFSPPFSSLYTYSASDRDMGNSADDDAFMAHFEFLIPELRRVIIPGRTACVHIQDVTCTKTMHGYIGKRDLPGEIIRAFQRHGWIYDGRITIDKDPQAAAIRTKSKQLLFVQKERDANWLMSCLPDYVLRFRDPRDNAVPVKTDVTNEEWILWARPIWYGIKETDTLSAPEARDEKDEKHICPLQLGTIERCVRLWTNPGELVLSPFGGIGSEGYASLRAGRRYTGIELKPSYWKQAVVNLGNARRQMALAL